MPAMVTGDHYADELTAAKRRGAPTYGRFGDFGFKRDSRTEGSLFYDEAGVEAQANLGGMDHRQRISGENQRRSKPGPERIPFRRIDHRNVGLVASQVDFENLALVARAAI